MARFSNWSIGLYCLTLTVVSLWYRRRRIPELYESTGTNTGHLTSISPDLTFSLTRQSLFPASCDWHVVLARRSGTEGERKDGPWRSRSARYAERLCRGTVSAFLKAGAGSWTSTVNIVAHIIEWAKAKVYWVRAA